MPPPNPAGRGRFCRRIMQPDDEKRLITYVNFSRAARHNRGTTVRLPGILLVHHVQTDQGTCFHCFHWNAGPKPNQLPDDHRLFLQKEKEELAVRPYFSGHSNASRLCAAAHCPKRPENSTGPLPTTVASDLPPPYCWSLLPCFHKASSQL